MIDDIKTLQNGVSFLELIEKDTIIIPKIQRDYAQGRETDKIYAIRESFISSLIEQLATDNKDPLSLDFIYGSEEGGQYFFPLDGQQRLTTLFLLHWYLSNDTSKLYIEKNGVIESKFTYHVRTSSKLFCNELVQHSREEIINEIDAESEDYCEEKEFSLSIKNQKWFLWEWNKDPTIKSMLVMIDAIHQRLRELKLEELTDRLENKKIIFNLLPLKEYGFKDELYVKMNVRGKPLSDFDILKSTFEEQMKKNKVSSDIQIYWQNHFDSIWFSMFWNAFARDELKQKQKIDEDSYSIVEQVEERYRNFLLRIISLYLIEKEVPFTGIDWDDIEIKNWIPEDDSFEGINDDCASSIIQSYSIGHSSELLPLLCKLNFFNEDFYTYLIDIFNSLIEIDGDNVESVSNGSLLIQDLYFDRDDRNPAQNLLEAFTNQNVTLEIRFQFFALILFLRHSSTIECNNDENKKIELHHWMRIIRNLATQTNTYLFNKQEEYISKIHLFIDISNKIYNDNEFTSIYNYIENITDFRLFRFDQLKEEQTKVQLFKSDKKWEELILLAENHPYLTGQIKFLLEWSNNKEGYDLVEFKNYYRLFSILFSDNGISEKYNKNNLFTNVMLKAFNVNYCFRGNNLARKDSLYCLVLNEGKDRDFSWKNYLRIGDYSIFLKNFLDKTDITHEDKLSSIANKTSGDWRDSLSKNPELISNWMYYRKFDFFDLPASNNIVRLFTKKTADSISSELETVRIYCEYDGYSSSQKKGESNKEYLFSNDTSYPYSACFYIDKKWEYWILIEYLEDKKKYQLETNFNPENPLFRKKDDYWYYKFERSELTNAEIILSDILQNSITYEEDE